MQHRRWLASATTPGLLDGADARTLSEHLHLEGGGVALLVALHLAALSPEPRTRGRPDPVTATAEVKLREAADLAELDSWLEPPERLAILGDPRLLLQAQALGSRLGRIAAG